MLNDLEALEVFASLCTTGSIQKTAQALGIDSPTASRKLTKLETQLGRQLINREKRPFEMTADACAIIGSVKKILEERQQIETYYRRLQSDDSMLIRVMIGNAHINFATKFILEYAEQFPKLRFNILTVGCAEFSGGQGGCHLFECTGTALQLHHAAERTDDFCAGCDASVSKRTRANQSS